MTRITRGSILAAAIALHLVVLAAPWIAPYDPTVQHRSVPFAPPTRVRFVDREGRWHARPFVCAIVQVPGTFFSYVEDCSSTAPMRGFVRRTEPVGFTTRTAWHLFGADAPFDFFVLGTDEFGRDVFSRLLVGARLSLAMAITAAGIALLVAVIAGSIAGYAGGVADAIVSAGTELVLGLPWLYLLVAVRAALPLSLPPAQSIAVIVGLLGFLGWARPGRLVRAVVAATRGREYVAAARMAGASTPRVLVRHILPEVGAVVAVWSVVLVRQFVLAETTLSLFGLGVPEPIPSWGTMLAAAQRPRALTETWWLLAPVAGLIVVCVVYYGLARVLRLDPQHNRT
jgi:peptide/nickel transport system permease protein